MTAEVVGYTGTPSGDLIIPETVEFNNKSYRVSSIAAEAFYGCSGFNGTLILPESIEEIGIRSFKDCNGFKGELIIPNSVTSLRDQAFAGCSGFTGNLVIPNSLRIIERGAFDGCSGFDGKLIIPNSVECIKNGAFTYCNGLTGDLVIPNSVKEIEPVAFRECSGFSGELKIPNSLSKIASGTFYNCSGFSSLVLPNTIISIESEAFSECSGLTGELDLPNTLTSIGGYAFSECKGLSGDLIIPNSVTYIGSAAFMNCSGFNGRLEIPNSVTYIDDRAFLHCGFTGDLIIPNSVTKIGYRAFWYCINFSGSLELSNKLTSIPYEAFAGLSEMKCQLQIPNSVQTIGERAFAGCSNLTSIDIPQSVIRIDDEAFSGCEGLTSITIPNSLLSIGSLVFLDCYNLTNFIVEDGESVLDADFNLPSSVTTLYLGRNLSQYENIFHSTSCLNNLTLGENITDIGETAFQDCGKLQNITVLATNPPLLFDTSFGQKAYDNGIVRVPGNSVEKYKSADGWKNFRDIDGFNEIRPTGIELEFDDIVIAAGDSMLLKAKIVPENATNQTIIWRSSEPEYLSIDSTGLMTALRQREYIKITASTSNGFSASRYVTVTPPPVKYISLSQDNWSGKVGEYFRIDAEVFPEEAEVKEIEWSSSDESIVTIDMFGIGVARGVGEADIIATSVSNNGVTAKCHITVIPTKIESIKLNTGWCYPGDIFQIGTWIYPETATDKTLSWSIADETIASVDSDGWVTAHVPGNTILTVKALDGSEVEETTDIIVYQIYVESISLTPDTWNGVEGESFKIEAEVIPENAYNKTLLWSSSDENVATVDQEGYVSVLKEGNCIITAASTDGLERSAECIITSVAGIDSIFSENDTFDVYNVNGILIRKDSNGEFLKNLTPDIYIVKQGSKMRKLIIR